MSNEKPSLSTRDLAWIAQEALAEIAARTKAHCTEFVRNAKAARERSGSTISPEPVAPSQWGKQEVDQRARLKKIRREPATELLSDFLDAWTELKRRFDKVQTDVEQQHRTVRKMLGALPTPQPVRPADAIRKELAKIVRSSQRERPVRRPIGPVNPYKKRFARD